MIVSVAQIDGVGAVPTSAFACAGWSKPSVVLMMFLAYFVARVFGSSVGRSSSVAAAAAIETAVAFVLAGAAEETFRGKTWEFVSSGCDPASSCSRCWLRAVP